jgi:nucleotidyltransferase substrate binding protein (TIGR01987 family)
MPFNTDYLQRTAHTLEQAYAALQRAEVGSDEYDVLRCAVVKGFELTLEVAGKLLRRALKAYIGNPKELDSLFYKDVLRQAGKRDLLTPEEIERWFIYRDNRNNTAHDYGADFANATLQLIPDFLRDVAALNTALKLRDFAGHA